MRILICLLLCTYGISSLIAQDDIPVVSSIEISIKTPTGDLYCTFTGPRKVGITPVVLIIPGSGPTDRDGNSITGLQTNVYKMLAENLAVKKIASIRIDKRGVGKSKGSVKSENDLMFDTYIEDAVAWINYLKTDLGYERIFIIGHNEGSLIGMAAANRTKISGFISIAGPGRSIDLVLRDQLKNLPLNLLDQANKILDSLKVGKTYPDVDPGLMAYFRPSVQPYLISWMKYDPVKEISKLRIPTLILHGSDDLQVPGEEALMLSQAKPSATLLYLDKMNHVLKDSGSDVQQNMATYKNPELPLHDQLIGVIVQFIGALNK